MSTTSTAKRRRRQAKNGGRHVSGLGVSRKKRPKPSGIPKK